jgi:hypothetical protein
LIARLGPKPSNLRAILISPTYATRGLPALGQLGLT